MWPLGSDRKAKHRVITWEFHFARQMAGTVCLLGHLGCVSHDCTRSEGERDARFITDRISARLTVL